MNDNCEYIDIDFQKNVCFVLNKNWIIDYDAFDIFMFNKLYNSVEIYSMKINLIRI